MYCKVWCHNFFSHLLQPLKMNMKIENPATYEVQLVIRFLKSKNVCLVLIHIQTVEACCEGAKNEGNGVACSKKAAQCAVTHHCRYMPITEQFNWAIFEHPPPYSPIFASGDYHLFLHLNKIWPTSLRNDQETKDWLKGLEVTFLNEG